MFFDDFHVDEGPLTTVDITEQETEVLCRSYLEDLEFVAYCAAISYGGFFRLQMLALQRINALIDAGAISEDEVRTLAEKMKVELSRAFADAPKKRPFSLISLDRSSG